MSAWLPVPGTTTGRLVAAALDQFGGRGFHDVGVADIARAAGVTTGSLYHHFGSKTGLWVLVRSDVEQRVIDRMEGAAAIREVRSISDLVLPTLVGFDYLARTRYARMLSEPSHPDSPAFDDDRIAAFFDQQLADTGMAVGFLLSAAWRAALSQAARFPDEAIAARAGLERLLAGG